MVKTVPPLFRTIRIWCHRRKRLLLCLGWLCLWQSTICDVSVVELCVGFPSWRVAGASIQTNDRGLPRCWPVCTTSTRLSAHLSDTFQRRRVVYNVGPSGGGLCARNFNSVLGRHSPSTIDESTRGVLTGCVQLNLKIDLPGPFWTSCCRVPR